MLASPYAHKRRAACHQSVIRSEAEKSLNDFSRLTAAFSSSTKSTFRERQRTQTLNEAFSELRRIIPSLPSDKMSKIKTLQLATRYIEFLDSILQFPSSEDTNKNNYASYMMSDVGTQQLADKDKFGEAFQLWRMKIGAECRHGPISEKVRKLDH